MLPGKLCSCAQKDICFPLLLPCEVSFPIETVSGEGLNSPASWILELTAFVSQQWVLEHCVVGLDALTCSLHGCQPAGVSSCVGLAAVDVLGSAIAMATWA